MKKKNVGKYLVFTLVSLLYVVPLIYVFSVSFSDEAQFGTYGYTLIPRKFSLLAYQFVFQKVTAIGGAYKISVVVTVLGTLLSLFVTSSLSYVLTRKDFVLHRFLNRFVLIPMLFSGGMVASYMVNTRLFHLQDTLAVLILPYVVVPWHVFLMRGFMKDLPSAIIESARIDGANEMTIYLRIVLPLSKAALATVGLFTAFIYWNDWWLSMLYINDRSLIPVQLLLYNMMNNISFLRQNAGASGVVVDLSSLPNESARMATCVLAVVPMMLVFPFIQKYFVKGLVVGSVKG